MKTKVESENRSSIQFNKRAVVGAFALLLLVPVAVRGGGVVANCTEADLRAAMAGGGLVTFACDSTITLANTITNETDTVLDATGHQVTISGGNSVRVFYVKPNVTFTVRNLAIANGSSIKGAGIFNEGGTVNLVGVTLASNKAIGFQYRGTALVPFGAAEGGGIFNQTGAVSAVSCVFSNNSAFQSLGPTDGPTAVPPFYLQAFGGAIRNAGGTITLQDCVLASNTVAGSAGRYGPVFDLYSFGWKNGLDGLGGAIHNSGNLTLERCSFLRNLASGGAGASYYLTSPGQPPGPSGSGGSGTGGAICNVGNMSLASAAFVSNSVTGGTGGPGPGGYWNPSTGPGGPGGPGGAGGNAKGSALSTSSGVASAVNCTLAWNASAAGQGGAGGNGARAIFNNSPGTDGGAGGNGGSAAGAISGTANLTNCSLAFNSAIFGPGGAGGPGGLGLGIGANGLPGPNGSAGVAGGGGLNGGSCVNTLLATNAPGGNNSGALTDLGYNLSSDATCAFSNLGSLNNTDPKLGPLANNGGPTLTTALLAGSPAIDAGDNASAPTTDQRGFPRPVGAGPDIGAYEYGYPAVLRILPAQEGEVGITVFGISGQWYRLLTSTNLSDWQCVATNQIGTNGTVLFQDNFGTGETQRFYRVTVP